MTTGKDIVELAEKHIGEPYSLGILVPKNDSSWSGPWDCAEFASYCVFQTTTQLYGCVGTHPAIADAYTGYWYNDARRIGTIISIDEVARIPGSFALRLGAKIGHIVISDGRGGTIEAHSSRTGVIQNTLSGRRWDIGIKVPWITYSWLDAVVVTPPTMVIYLTYPYMRGSAVEKIQSALQNIGLYEEAVDGIFGPKTAAAVRVFQEVNGLVVDGEVGRQTAGALEVSL